MRRMRALCAVLLLAAFALGGPACPTIHQHAVGTAALDDAQLGHVQHRQDHQAKLDPEAICKLACAAAAAVLEPPHRGFERPLAHPPEYALAAPAPLLGAVRAPDPFPPRPSRTV